MKVNASSIFFRPHLVFEISSLVFHRRKYVVVWKAMLANKWWQNYNFWSWCVTCLAPFVLRRLTMFHIMWRIKEMCGITVRERTWWFSPGIWWNGWKQFPKFILKEGTLWLKNVDAINWFDFFGDLSVILLPYLIWKYLR